MAKYPRHSFDNRPIIETPQSIENLEEIERAVRKNQDRRKRQLAEQREAAEKSKKRMRIVIAIGVVIVLTVATLTAFNIVDNSRFAHAMELPQREVVIHQGDTLDGIAAENPVEGLSPHELGWVIGEINRDSDTISSPLIPGDRIMIPVEN